MIALRRYNQQLTTLARHCKESGQWPLALKTTNNQSQQNAGWKKSAASWMKIAVATVQQLRIFAAKATPAHRLPQDQAPEGADPTDFVNREQLREHMSDEDRAEFDKSYDAILN